MTSDLICVYIAGVYFCPVDDIYCSPSEFYDHYPVAIVDNLMVMYAATYHNLH